MSRLTSTATRVLAIDEVIEIAAPADVVWRVLTDLDRYGEWNPFVVACRSTLVPGEPIVMRVRVLPWFAQPQTETIFEHVPGRRFSYGVAGGASAPIRSRRSHDVEALGPDRTRYTSRFALDGWAAPIVRTLLGGRLRHGFHAMTAAIGERALKV